MFQERNQLPEFKNTLSILLLHDRGSREWPMIQNPVHGPDWVSGGDYFIRNRRQPELYWHVHDAHIHTSSHQRTKFHIEKVKTRGEREPVVLIREDMVTIRAIPETVTSWAVANGSTYVSINSDNTQLSLVKNEVTWKFGELVNGKVGVRWENEGGAREDSTDAKAFLVQMTSGGGDEWELV